MKDLILVKLGGSLITDKSRPYTVRQEVMERLAKEIKESGCENLIVSHGQGSYGHQPAHEYQINEGIINEKSYRGLSIVQDVAAQLNRIVVSTFIKNGINAMSVQPSCSAVCKNGRIVEWDISAINEMIKQKQLPVPYGDIGFDLAKGCCIISADEIMNFFASNMEAKRVIMVGKVDGVMTADPSKDKNAKLIPKITMKNYDKIKSSLTGSDGVDVTGGMLSKVDSLLELAKKGIESEIINGDVPGNLKRALRGEKVTGTVIRK
jgi:isopentenyl phosphate kinase